MPKISLVAVQARLRFDDYASPLAFALAVRRDAHAASAAIFDTADGALVVFPEHLGFLLSVVPYHLAVARRCSSFASFIAEVAGSDSREARYELFVRHSTEVAGAYDALFFLGRYTEEPLLVFG